MSHSLSKPILVNTLHAWRWLALVMVWCVPVIAQSGKAVVPENSGSSPRTSLKEETAGPDASPEAKPRTASSDSADDGIPAFHLARLKLTGQVENDRAMMTAEIDVDVNRDQAGYHDVPLRFQQAHFIRKEYSGPGREGPVLDTPQEEGIVWRFSGHGTHHLKLVMWVPIKETPAGRQLLLALPTMPQGFDAQVELNVPGAPVVFRGNREMTVLSSSSEKGQNRISADVRGPRLDLTWSEPPDVQTLFRQVTSQFTIHRDADRVVVQTEQVLIPENSGIRTADIKLPDGFDLEDVTGPLLKSHEPIESRPGWHKLTFREGALERIELNWQLSAAFAAEGGTLGFDGLTVADARNQSGRIRLQEFPGYQMVPRPGQFVRRAPASQPQIAEVFEYTRQPFRIEWSVQKIVAKYSARARSTLSVTTSQLSLDQKYVLQVDSGTLDGLELLWPDAANSGWRLDIARLPEDLFVPSDGDRLGRDGKLTVRWKTPRGVGNEVNLRFVRPMNPDSMSARIQLPVLSGARILTSELVIAAEDQLEVLVKDAQGNPVAPATIDPSILSDFPASTSAQIRLAMPEIADGQAVDLQWKSQPRSIDADAEVELRRAASGRIRVQQTVNFRIRFGRLDTAVLIIPAALEKYLVPGTSSIGGSVDGTPVTPVHQGGTLTVPFPSARIGNVRVTIDYSLPIDSSITDPVPVLKSQVANYAHTRVRIPEGESLRVAANNEAWQPIPTAPDALMWISSTGNDIPLVLEADQTSAPRFSIEQVFHRTRLNSQGHLEGVCELHWTAGVRTLTLNLPPQSELLAVRSNGVNLSPTGGQIQFDPKVPEQISIRVPSTSGDVHLAILYRSVKEREFQQRDLRTITLPILPSDASVVHSYWELELPVGRHLFIGPSNLTAEHRWQRTGLFWSRIPGSSYSSQRADAYSEAALLTTIPEASVVYAFSSIGRIESATFQSMSRSLILLMGAGVTLALGFLFWNLPATRNMLTLLSISFVISVLSLWFLEPIQLLLQPAALGVVLAIVATLVDVKSRRMTTIYLPPVAPTVIAPGNLGSAPVLPREEVATPTRGSSSIKPLSHPIAQTAVFTPTEVPGS